MVCGDKSNLLISNTHNLGLNWTNSTRPAIRHYIEKCGHNTEYFNDDDELEKGFRIRTLNVDNEMIDKIIQNLSK